MAKNKIIHLIDWKRKKVKKRFRECYVDYPYYKCNHAVGVANPNKISTKKNKITCKNCIKWYITKVIE